MLPLAHSARLLWLAIVALALPLVGISVLAATRDLRLAPAALAFAVAGAISETFHVTTPSSRLGQRLDLAVASALYVAAVLVFPLHWAILVVALSWAFVHATARRVAWFKATYNVAQAALSAAAAGAVWYAAGPDRSVVLFSSLPAAVAGALCYLATNTMLVAAIMALASGRPAGRMWWRTHKPVLPYYAALAATGIVLAALWIQTPWLVPCVLLLLAALYYALRNTVALETTTVSSLFRLADILDARDRYTHGHAVRVGEYAERLALALGVPDSRAFLVLLAGRLHDIGKCAVRNEVLLKPGALDEAERAHMCTHPAVGGEMLAAYPFFGEIAADVRGHHERWDGKGYPDGLAGNAIPLGARIIAVVDAWDAMTSSRPYRSALPHEEAIRRLSEGAGTQWEPAIVAAFLSLVAQDSSIGRSAAPIAGCGAPVAVLDRTPRASDGTPLAA